MDQEAVGVLGYKPSLTVDVSADLGKDDLGNADCPSAKKTQTPHVSTNIFIAGIPSSWDEQSLRDRYTEFGEVVSTKVVPTRHFGFVMFKKPESAHAAINATHMTRPIPNCPTVLHVSIAMHDEGLDDQPNDRLFIRGLPQWATKEHLRHIFSPYGTIVDCAVLMNPLGQCKGSGFVQFSSTEEATKALKTNSGISIEGWPHPLEVKYSESVEARLARQERNRNRQRHWPSSPQYRAPSTPGSMNSAMMGFSPSMSVMPSPQGFPVMSTMIFPFVYPQSPPATGAPTQIVYPPPVIQSMPPFYPPGPVQLPVSPSLPQKGDLHFSGCPLTSDMLQLLLQPFGDIEALCIMENDGGAAVRLKDVSKHPMVVQQLNGTLFPMGQIMAVGIYA